MTDAEGRDGHTASTLPPPVGTTDVVQRQRRMLK